MQFIMMFTGVARFLQWKCKMYETNFLKFFVKLQSLLSPLIMKHFNEKIPIFICIFFRKMISECLDMRWNAEIILKKSFDLD